MASPLVSRTPTCLACIRRINPSVASGSLALTQQTRGKKTKSKAKPKKLGVVVRLLQDLEKYGKEGSIMRVGNGIMRNDFYPKSIAEYLPLQRFTELGLTKADICERDTQYGLTKQYQEEEIDDAVEHIAGGGDAYAAAVAAGVNPFGTGLPGGFSAPGIEAPDTVPAMEVEQLAPNRALELLQKLIPDPIIIERYPISQFARRKIEPETPPEPQTTEAAVPGPEGPALLESEQPVDTHRSEETISPVQQQELQRQVEEMEKVRLHPEEAAAEVRAEKAKDRPATSPLDPPGEEITPHEVEKERQQVEEDAEELLRIHGSVTRLDIVTDLKKKHMLFHPEAARIDLQAEEIIFIGLEEGLKHVKKLGTFDIEIRAHVGKTPVEPVRRRLEVVPILS